MASKSKIYQFRGLTTLLTIDLPVSQRQFRPGELPVGIEVQLLSNPQFDNSTKSSNLPVQEPQSLQVQETCNPTKPSDLPVQAPTKAMDLPNQFLTLPNLFQTQSDQLIQVPRQLSQLSQLDEKQFSIIENNRNGKPKAEASNFYSGPAFPMPELIPRTQISREGIQFSTPTPASGRSFQADGIGDSPISLVETKHFKTKAYESRSRHFRSRYYKITEFLPPKLVDAEPSNPKQHRIPNTEKYQSL
jgi:hypothetical protein